MCDSATVERKVMLICIDGWGIGDNADPGNAVIKAETPVMSGFAANKDQYCEAFAHGLEAGLPEGVMGNSEVGHLTIGAGRVQFQDLVRINLAVKDNSIRERPALVQAFQKAVAGNGRVHFLGLVSDGGVHSHINHLKALIDAAKSAQVPHTFVHFFADGRDTPPKSSLEYVQQLQNHLDEGAYGSIASVTGRYYAMDRDKRWERIELAYNGLVKGEGEQSSKDTLINTIQSRYEAGETDEFLKPIIVNSEGVIRDGDVLVFFDFRADRMREIVETLGVAPPFETDIVLNDLHVVQFTEYKSTFDLPIVFEAQSMDNTLSEWISKQGLRQFHTAETEKYAHVTFFFNGGREEPFANEDREMVPSPKVATYDLQPEMNLIGVRDSVINALASQKYPFVVCNFAPPDMVGHTGKFNETVTAVSATDRIIGDIFKACKEHGYVLAVTSDHGNCEVMIDENGKPKTSHTCNKVPVVFAGDDSVRISGENAGIKDVAPTILDLMGLPIPLEMTGKSLLIK